MDLCICDPEQRRCTRLQTLFWVSLSRVTPPNPAKNLLRTMPLYWILLATSTAFLAVKLVAPFFLPHQPFPTFPTHYRQHKSGRLVGARALESSVQVAWHAKAGSTYGGQLVDE